MQWHIADVSSAIPAGQRPQTLRRGAIHYEYLADGSSNSLVQDIFGLATDGSLERVYWQQVGPDQWMAENVSGIETALAGP